MEPSTRKEIPFSENSQSEFTRTEIQTFRYIEDILKIPKYSIVRYYDKRNVNPTVYALLISISHWDDLKNSILHRSTRKNCQIWVREIDEIETLDSIINDVHHLKESDFKTKYDDEFQYDEIDDELVIELIVQSSFGPIENLFHILDVEPQYLDQIIQDIYNKKIEMWWLDGMDYGLCKYIHSPNNYSLVELEKWIKGKCDFHFIEGKHVK